MRRAASSFPLPRLASKVDWRLACARAFSIFERTCSIPGLEQEAGLPRFGCRCFLGQGQRGLDQRAQLIEGQGLGQVIEGACLEGRDGVFGAAERGDTATGRSAHWNADETHQLQPITVWQAHVGKAEVIPLGLQQLLGRRRGTDALNRQTHAQERQLEQFRMSASSSITSTVPWTMFVRRSARRFSTVPAIGS